MKILRLLALTVIAWTLAAQSKPPVRERPLHVPEMPESRILQKVNPVYPLAAIQRHIEGSVWFSAVIGKDGRVESLRWISGHPLLIAAAREAARQWVFRPAKVGGVPVRVITRIPIHFNLAVHQHPEPVV